MVYIPTFNMANVGKYTRLGPMGIHYPGLVKGFFMAMVNPKSCTSEN